jgi:ABC-type uncharacterized transport system substrate-binding protein
MASPIERRKFLATLGGAAAAWPLAARAQQAGKVARIGFLRYASPHQKQFDGFRDGLRANGYVEGQNIVIEQRYADGAFDRLGELAAELVRLNLDVIVVDGSATAKVVKAATSSIPVVFALATDPVGDGLATSMARPGTNLTGLTLSVGYQLAGKRVELLKDLKSDLSRLAVLIQPNNLTHDSYLQDAERVGRALDLSTRVFAAQSVDDLPRAFAAMVEWRANGVITLNDAFLFHPTRARGRADARQQARCRASGGGVRGGRWSSFIWRESERPVPAHCFLRRQNTQRDETGRNTHRAAEQVRPCCKSQDGANAWIDGESRISVARRRGD